MMEDLKTALSLDDGELDIRCNVAIRKTNGDTGETETQYYHNRVTKTALMGVLRFIYGDFNFDTEVTHQAASKYTPKYLALGGYRTNVMPPEWSTYAVTVGVNVTKLDHEFEDEDRVIISNRQITNNINDNFITLSFRVYVPTEIYKHTYIKEAGLFIDEEGDNCWSKIAVTNPISKGAHDFVDVLWDVRISSTGASSEDLHTEILTYHVGDEVNFKLIPKDVPDVNFAALIDGYTGGIDVDTTKIKTFTENGLTFSLDKETDPDTHEEYDVILVTGTPEEPGEVDEVCYFKDASKRINFKYSILIQE